MVKQLLASTASLALREALVAAGAPEDKATKAAAELEAKLKALVAPTVPPDMTPKEVAVYRRESDSTVQRKMRLEIYQSYLSGPGLDKRLVTRESVERDREACLAAGPRFGEGPHGRRPQPLEGLVEKARAQITAREQASPEAAKRGRGRPRKAISHGRGGEGQPGSEEPPTTV
jgi:hypothetical protein